MELMFMGRIVDVWYKAKMYLENRNMLSYDNVVEIINQNMNKCVITFLIWTDLQHFGLC